MESSVICILYVFAAILVNAAAHSSHVPLESGCYDCNYSPSGHVKGTSGWQQSSAEVGYQKCALVLPSDALFVHKSTCHSNRCYIRQEENGIVYRGCADYENLPWDVNTHMNCKHQGPGKSLWYFCDGDACNRGQLGDSEERCGSPPVKQPEVIQQPVTIPPPVYTNEDYPIYDDQFQSFPRYIRWGGRIVALYPFYRYHNAPNYVHYEQGPVDEAQKQPEVITKAPVSTTPKAEYNPCDGRCEYNPSGLFADPERDDHFIQCGCDFKGGRPCTCCQKFYLSCDPNTFFDDSKKVCIRRQQPY